jgi:hypothetical protein
MKNHTASADKFIVYDRNLIMIFIISKIIVVALIIFFFYHFASMNNNNPWNRFYTGEGAPNSVFLPFSNWDGQHYLLLADRGYEQVNNFRNIRGSLAFFPLFPELIRLLGFLTGNFYLSAFIINLVFSFLFILFFYNYALEYCTDKFALKCVCFILTFTTSFYLSVFYSEAVFLFLLFGFLYCYKKESYLSVVFAVFMPLARAQAFFVLIALMGIITWRLIKKEKINFKYELCNFSGIIAGFSLYMMFMYLTTGSAFSGLDVQKYFVFGNSLLNCFNPVHFITFLFSGSKELFSYNNSITDKAHIIFFLASIPFILKSKDPVIICMFIALAYFPASMGNGGAYMRYSLSAIPFLSLVLFSTYREYRIIRISMALVFLALQVYCIYRFSLNMWVG